MSTTTKTVEEFCSRRKIRYGGSDSQKPSYTLTSSSATTLSPHKHYYANDKDGNQCYFIEFNIGDFKFDEITIKTEGQRLVVSGKNKLGEGKSDEYTREFNRDFTLPYEVDPYSIKAQLDDVTRQLTLIGKIQAHELNKTKATANLASGLNNSSGLFNSSTSRLGEANESKSLNTLEYNIYLGNDLKTGKVSLETTEDQLLIVKVNKIDSDLIGEFNLDLKRVFKLPNGANVFSIKHEIDQIKNTLKIKIPLDSK